MWAADGSQAYVTAAIRPVCVDLCGLQTSSSSGKIAAETMCAAGAAGLGLRPAEGAAFRVLGTPPLPRELRSQQVAPTAPVRRHLRLLH